MSVTRIPLEWNTRMNRTVESRQQAATCAWCVLYSLPKGKVELANLIRTCTVQLSSLKEETFFHLFTFFSFLKSEQNDVAFSLSDISLFYYNATFSHLLFSVQFQWTNKQPTSPLTGEITTIWNRPSVLSRTNSTQVQFMRDSVPALPRRNALRPSNGQFPFQGSLGCCRRRHTQKQT